MHVDECVHPQIISKAAFVATGNRSYDVLTGRTRTTEYPRFGVDISKINPTIEDVIRRNAGGVGADIGMNPDAPWNTTADAKNLMHQWIVWVYMETCNEGASLQPVSHTCHIASHPQPRRSCSARAPRRSRACTCTT